MHWHFFHAWKYFSYMKSHLTSRIVSWPRYDRICIFPVRTSERYICIEICIVLAGQRFLWNGSLSSWFSCRGGEKNDVKKGVKTELNRNTWIVQVAYVFYITVFTFKVTLFHVKCWTHFSCNESLEWPVVIPLNERRNKLETPVVAELLDIYSQSSSILIWNQNIYKYKISINIYTILYLYNINTFFWWNIT